VRWVGLVRNVMLGRDGLDRAGLVAAAEAAGATEVRSHLTTGNLTFTAAEPELDAVVDRLEVGVRALLGRHEPVAVRSARWLELLVGADRFARYDDALEQEVSFLRHDAEPIDPTRLGDPGRTVVVDVLDRELLTARPRAGGNRPHANRLLEAATGRPATARGWRTLQRLAATFEPGT
jgi:uncharacterized protein (DUF1697 family)